jgi:poly(3-hydroxybutyrate) depolymerase
MRAFVVGVVCAALSPGIAQAAAPPPGPPLLYDPPPAVSPLEVSAPFAAPPLLVSGTDAYRDGEYLYQDYLFDDRGADTVPGPGTRFDNGREAATPTAGDVQYPTAARYGANAADLVEFRVKPTADAIVYRVTLNTAREADAAVVGIGIDTDRSGGASVEWPEGAGVSSPGLDRFITAWGTGGSVTTFPGSAQTTLPDGSVSIDLERNQMTISVPRSVMDPGGATWRYFAGVGLWDGSGWKPVPPGVQPADDTAASGNPAMDAPAVYNLAFRFDEPVGSLKGNWFEDAQAAALGARDTAPFHADVDFAALAGGAGQWLHAPGRLQARIFASHFEPYEGVAPQQLPVIGFGTRLQPYVLSVPPSYNGAAAPLTLALHPGNSSYAVYAVNDPNLYRQLGDERGSFVLTPFARAPDTRYQGLAEADVFEAWADAARQFKLDPARTTMFGYSIGGFAAYRLAVHNPDLFARVVTAVGLPADQGWAPPAPPEPGGQVSNTNPLLDNLRWTPIMQWAQAVDELNPYTGAHAQQERLNALGYRSRFWTFTNGEHFTLALEDEWAGARDWLGDSRVESSPDRVDYAFMPQADAPEVGLRADHAYWVYDLEARVRDGDPQTAPARAQISARSLAFGRGAPAPVTIDEPGTTAGPPTPTLVEGVDWTGIPSVPVRNALQVELSNIAAAAVDGVAARLDGKRRLEVSLTSDGTGQLRLALKLPRGARAKLVSGGGPGWSAAADTQGVTFTTAAGRAVYVIS